MNSVFSITGTPIGAGALPTTDAIVDDDGKPVAIIPRPKLKRPKRKSGLGGGGIS